MIFKSSLKYLVGYNNSKTKFLGGLKKPQKPQISYMSLKIMLLYSKSMYISNGRIIRTHM